MVEGAAHVTRWKSIEVRAGQHDGIVAFPSFHTVIAVIFVYVHRPPLRKFRAGRDFERTNVSGCSICRTSLLGRYDCGDRGCDGLHFDHTCGNAVTESRTGFRHPVVVSFRLSARSDLAEPGLRGPQQAVRFTKRSLNNWLRVAGPAFDASLALEMMGFFSADLSEGVAALQEKRQPSFPGFNKPKS